MYTITTKTVTYNRNGDSYELNDLVYIPSADTKLCKWSARFGRMGSLDGVFFVEPAIIRALIDHEVHLGEVLGKHSEIEYTFDPSDFTIYDVTEQTVADLAPVLDSGYTMSGINPIERYLNHLIDTADDDYDTGYQTQGRETLDNLKIRGLIV